MKEVAVLRYWCCATRFTNVHRTAITNRMRGVPLFRGGCPCTADKRTIVQLSSIIPTTDRYRFRVVGKELRERRTACVLPYRGGGTAQSDVCVVNILHVQVNRAYIIRRKSKPPPGGYEAGEYFRRLHATYYCVCAGDSSKIIVFVPAFRNRITETRCRRTSDPIYFLFSASTRPSCCVQHGTSKWCSRALTFFSW